MSYLKLQARKAQDVTPSDTENISLDNADNRGSVLYIGTGGNLKVKTSSGDDVIFKNIADGVFLPVQVVRVFSTETTATDIIALW